MNPTLTTNKRAQLLPMVNGDPRYPAIDGFNFWFYSRTDYDYLALALEALEPVRRAGRYRTRWLMIPEDTRMVIPPYDEYAYQLDVTPGSVYWGYSFATQANGNLFTISDGCTEEDVFSEAMLEYQNVQVKLFSYPLIIGQPGILNVRIATLNAAGSNLAQLVLHGSQPISDEEM